MLMPITRLHIIAEQSDNKFYSRLKQQFCEDDEFPDEVRQFICSSLPSRASESFYPLSPIYSN